MDLETFLKLSPADIAQIVRDAGVKVVVFPVNGTRRWFMLEHPDPQNNFISRYQAYKDITAQKYIEIFKLVFDQGLDTLLTPEFGSELLTRGATYANLATEALAYLATYPPFLDFYETYQVRVRFYGDYRRVLANTPYAYLINLFDELTQRTLTHSRYRLFYGICANDATEQVAELAVQHYQKFHSLPDRRAIVTLYYGEYVDPVSFFIGFDKFSAFDMPLLALGEEDLYFTVAPSLYLTERQLREIIYDHLYTRRVAETENWSGLASFYTANRGQTLGIGKQRDGFWYPLPQVTLPTGF